MADSGIPADDKNIARRSFKAAGWVLVIQFTMQFVQILLGICLGRILTPEDYGTIGMLSIFWAVSVVFIYGGFSQALIQRKEITETDLSSVFYYNVFLSFFFFALMNLSARRIALFYGQDVLEPMIRVMAWILPIGALSAIQMVLLSRQLKQFFVTVSTLVSNLTAGLIALIVLFYYLGRMPLLKLYLKSDASDAVRQMASHGLIIAPLGLLFFGYNILGIDTSIALHEKKISTALSVLENVIFANLTMLTLPFLFGVPGVWFAFPVGEIFTFGGTLFFLNKIRQAYNKN